MKKVVALLTKRYELWPLAAVVGFTVCGLVPGFIGWSSWIKDLVVTRGRNPWDNLDLPAHAYSRELRQVNEELVDMNCLYKEMDEKQRQRRKSDENR